MSIPNTSKIPFPVESERLIIRPFKEDDAPYIAQRLAKDHDGYLPDDFLLGEARSYIHYLQTQKRDGELNIQLFMNDDKTVVGEIRATRHTNDPTGWEIAYDAIPAYEGHGYMTEGLEALKDLFRNAAGARRFAASVVHENDRSRAVMERTGFRRISADKERAYFEYKF